MAKPMSGPIPTRRVALYARVSKTGSDLVLEPKIRDPTWAAGHERAKARVDRTDRALRKASAAAKDAAIAWEAAISSGPNERVAAARDVYYAASNAYRAIVRGLEEEEG